MLNGSGSSSHIQEQGVTILTRYSQSSSAFFPLSNEISVSVVYNFLGSKPKPFCITIA